MTPDACPHCGVSLLGEPIPETLRLLSSGGATHYRREIGIEIPEVYDGVLYWACPDCGGAWHRFGEVAHPLHYVAEPYVQQANATRGIA